MSSDRCASNRPDSRWKRLRRRIQERKHHARQYRDELDEQRLRFGLERANREVRALGCDPGARHRRSHAVAKDAPRAKMGRRIVAWLRAMGFLE